jgi:taurine transport system permease protein
MNKSVAKRFAYLILSFSSIALFVVIWVILANTEGSMLPTPAETFARFVNVMTKQISKATLPTHIWVSLRRVLIAFAFAVALGITLGVALGWSAVFNASIGPIFEMIRPIPPIAWIPMVIMWFGIGETAKIVIVFIGAFMPIVLNTSAGIRAIDPLLISAGKVLGANRRQLLIDVAFPATIPAILAGVRTALSGGWMCVVAAEMIAAKQGVGFLIVRGQEIGDTALIVVCMLAIGLVSFLLSFILQNLEGVLCPWQFSKTK